MPVEIIHLDALFWEPGGFDRRRSAGEIERLVRESKRHESWIVEGVFGELAELYFSEAECLIWLDIEWCICKARLEVRGSESRKHLGREQAEEGLALAELMDWAQNYYNRADLRSHKGHSSLFDRFDKARMHLVSQDSVVVYLRDVRHCVAAEDASILPS